MQGEHRRGQQVHVAAREGDSTGEGPQAQADRPGEEGANGAALPLDQKRKGGIGGWVQTFVVVLVALAALIGPKAGIDAYFSWRWQERLAEIRAPYEFERRETLFKLCASFLEWETKYGDHPSMEHMDLICIPDIPVRQPMLVKNVVLKKQDRLRPE